MNPQQRMNHYQISRISRRGTGKVTGFGVAVTLLVAALASAAAGSGGSSSSTPVPQPSAAQLKAAELHDLPLAPKSARADLTAPPFSNSTDVTNPLFPISKLHSVVLNGKVDSKPFRTETTLLPNTRFIEWIDGQRVEVVVSQYTAYLDGRLEEEEEAGVRGTGLLLRTNQSIRCDCQRLSNRQWRLTMLLDFPSAAMSTTRARVTSRCEQCWNAFGAPKRRGELAHFKRGKAHGSSSLGWTRGVNHMNVINARGNTRTPAKETGTI